MIFYARSLSNVLALDHQVDMYESQFYKTNCSGYLEKNGKRSVTI